MAIINAYSNPVITGNVITKSGRGLISNGADGCTLFAQCSPAASDNNGSIYRLFKNLNRNITILGIQVANTVLTTGTSYGLGLYATDLSTTLYTTAAYFSGAMNLTTGHANITSGYLDGMLGITMATAGAGYDGFPTLAYQNRLFEHAGFSIGSNPSTPDSFDLCLTATTASTVAGTVAVLINFVYD
jgi:hypothetical protein